MVTRAFFVCNLRFEPCPKGCSVRKIFAALTVLADNGAKLAEARQPL